jgi:hypothetical protein
MGESPANAGMPFQIGSGVSRKAAAKILEKAARQIEDINF